MDEGILGTVRGLDFVSDALADDSGLVVYLEDPERHTPELVRRLVAAGAEILSVTEEIHSLEEIYLRLMAEEREEKP